MPLRLRYAARVYFSAIEAINTNIVGIEYSGKVGSRIFSIDSIMISVPAAIMISAMITVLILSILLRYW